MKTYIFIFSLLFICRTGFAQDLSVQSNITISTGTVLSVEGSVTHVSGSINNAGTIKFQGSAAKNFDGNNLRYIGTLEFNGGTTTLTGKVRIPGGINPGTIVISGTGVLNTGNKLTLMTDSMGTARIAEITSSANRPLVSSNDSIVIATTSGYNSFRFFGNPFYTQLPLTQFTDGPLEIDITGPGGTASGFSVSTTNNNPSAFKYSESTNK